MKWKLILAAGAIVSGVALAARLRNQKTLEDSALWAEATDPVAPSGTA